MKIFLKKKFNLWIQGQRLKCQISLRTLNLLEIIYLQCLCKLIKYILSIKDKTCLILQIGVNKKYKKKMRQKSKIVSN